MCAREYERTATVAPRLCPHISHVQQQKNVRTVILLLIHGGDGDDDGLRFFLSSLHRLRCNLLLLLLLKISIIVLMVYTLIYHINIILTVNINNYNNNNPLIVACTTTVSVVWLHYFFATNVRETLSFCRVQPATDSQALRRHRAQFILSLFMIRQ